MRRYKRTRERVLLVKSPDLGGGVKVEISKAGPSQLITGRHSIAVNSVVRRIPCSYTAHHYQSSFFLSPLCFDLYLWSIIQDHRLLFFLWHVCFGLDSCTLCFHTVSLTVAVNYSQVFFSASLRTSCIFLPNTMLLQRGTNNVTLRRGIAVFVSNRPDSKIHLGWNLLCSLLSVTCSIVVIN